MENPFIRSYVCDGLEKGWSPEQIAARISIDYPGISISYETIYQWCYRKQNRRWARLLPTRRLRRRRRYRGLSAPAQSSYLSAKQSIIDRPQEIADRSEFGHWEADTLIGPRGGSSCVVLTELKSRLTFISVLTNRKALTFKEAVISCLSLLPHSLRRSITGDNGGENADWRELERILGLQFYFCRPYKSWEKGTVENTNGLIRRRFSKSCDFRFVSQADILAFQKQLNNRPRKVLGFRTPYEVFSKILESTPESHSGALAY